MIEPDPARLRPDGLCGEFAREWILENQAGRPVFHALESQQAQRPLEQVGAQLREMMPWLTGR